jgi:ADP-ribose pyrophosphatase YjhB (NUDIX family)
VDVNDAPSSAVVREIHEESGFNARPCKLAALYDRNHARHGHPPGIHHIYKLFFLCELLGGTAQTSIETDGVDFFALDGLPALSTGRVTRTQIERMYEHHLKRDLPTDFD